MVGLQKYPLWIVRLTCLLYLETQPSLCPPIPKHNPPHHSWHCKYLPLPLIAQLWAPPSSCTDLWPYLPFWKTSWLPWHQNCIFFSVSLLCLSVIFEVCSFSTLPTVSALSGQPPSTLSLWHFPSASKETFTWIHIFGLDLSPDPCICHICSWRFVAEEP